MKKQIYTYIGLIVILTVSSVSAIRAQSQTIAKINIPFEFSVRNQTIKAGRYVINRNDDQGMVWSLSGSDNRQMVILTANAEPKGFSRSGNLTFRRYGDKYFLAEIETSYHKIGLRKSRAERNLQRKLAASKNLAKNSMNKTTPEIVVVEITM